MNRVSVNGPLPYDATKLILSVHDVSLSCVELGQLRIRGSLTGSTKPLHKLILIDLQWSHMVFIRGKIGRNFSTYMYQALKWVWILYVRYQLIRPCWRHVSSWNLVNNGSSTGLSPVRRQTITWTNADLVFARTNFSEISNMIHIFLARKIFENVVYKMATILFRPQLWPSDAMWLHNSESTLA